MASDNLFIESIRQRNPNFVFKNFHYIFKQLDLSKPKLVVISVEQGGHVPPQVLGYQLTLFGPRVADYARHITTGRPIFLDDTASLHNYL